MSRIIAIIAGILLGGALVSLVGPMVGEIIATLPPYFPHNGKDPMSVLGLYYEEVSFLSTDNLTLRGWFIPADKPDAPAIVYAPGTQHDQTSGLQITKPLHEAGYHVLLFSYRGSGASDGNELGFTYGQAESQDLDAAVAFLSESKAVRDIGVIGFSAGAATSILSTARNPRINVVVAASPFASISEVWQTNSPKFMPAWFVDWTMRMAENRKGFSRENIKPINVIHDISPRPMLSIQGEKDSRVTVSQARRLYARAGAPSQLWIVSDATHRMVHDSVLVDLAPDIIAFLNSTLHASPPDAHTDHVNASYRRPVSMQSLPTGFVAAAGWE